MSAAVRALVVAGAAASLAGGLASACTFPSVTFAGAPDGSSGALSGSDASDTDSMIAFEGDDAGGSTGDGGPVFDGASLMEAGDAGCFAGTWATRITIPVSWQPQGLDNFILKPGTGQIRQFVRGVRTQNGAALIDDSTVCDIQLPDFTSTLSETYGVRFPTTFFDNTYAPKFKIGATLSPNGDGDGGVAYNTTETAVVIGLTLMNPNTDPWPTTVTTAVDSDMDGPPGVTVVTATGLVAGSTTTMYSDIPVDVPPLLLQADRTNQLSIALRQLTIASGTVQDCAHIAGNISIPQVPSASGSGTKYAIDSHVIGCVLTDGGACTTSQVAFVDNTQPVFTPMGQPVFESVRIDAGASCGDVRGTAFAVTP
ncbi:MAG TPA: hypothetical protein VHV30_04995 [Polyangiaceae bacterium]|nr:hypothetical protein [Polyangiaceae bacterium]